MRRRRRLRWGRIFALIVVIAGISWGLRQLPALSQAFANLEDSALDSVPDHLGQEDSRPLIALDPGHGGSDPGAEGYVVEAEVAEAVVKELERLLKEDGGYRVMVCREYGEGEEVNARWQKANEAGADMVLCIHANFSEDTTAQGFEVYPAPTGREYHEESLALARLIAAEMGDLGLRLRGDGGIRYIYYRGEEKLLSDYPDESLEKLPSFAMVDYPECPAILAEQGFVTHKKDAELLGSAEFCKKAAAAYYNAVRAYFEQAKK